MQIWKVNYRHSDGYTCSATECVSIHKSEEGAALAIDKYKEQPSTQFPGLKEYELGEHNSFEIEETVLEE